MLILRMTSLFHQFPVRAETQIRFTFAQQPLGLLTIEIETVALTIRSMRTTDVRAFVPVKAKPLQVFEELAFEALFAALDIGVLDAQNHDPAFLPREQPVKQRGTGVTDM